MRAEEYISRFETVDSWEINIVSYKLGDRYICWVSNVEPGANLCKAEGTTREQAEERAVEKAKGMLSRTRVFQT